MAGKLKCKFLSWQEVGEFSRKVGRKIKEDNFKPDWIVGMTRGGWIPAVLLSDELGIKNLLSLKTEHWGITARKDEQAHLAIPLNFDLSGKKILLVDDLTDTGESIQLARKHLKKLRVKEIKVATLIHKSQSKIVPDFFAQKVEKWKWIILPWNLNEDLANLMKKVSSKKLSSQEMKTQLKEEFGIDVDEKLIQHILKNDY